MQFNSLAISIAPEPSSILEGWLCNCWGMAGRKFCLFNLIPYLKPARYPAKNPIKSEATMIERVVKFFFF
jgi:hypothetical protein